MKNIIGVKRLLLSFAALCAFVPAATAQDPGEDTYAIGPSDVEYGSLAPVVTESGQISLSVDAAGFSNPTGSIQVNKPAGATVRRAYLAAASTGFSGRKLTNTDVKLDGANVAWLLSTTSSISSWNHWADVTSIVKSKIDGAAPGVVNFALAENQSPGIDGEILAVIFDDPNQTTTNTIIFAFGSQKIEGDEFNIALGNPVDKSDPNLAIDFSLGISFGFQQNNNALQRSIINVNNVRLTSVAGGQDDGQASNGALITVGGFDDSNANPDPNNTSSGPHYDDELYNLLPLVANGATAVKVFSQNPSNDDNIFFAALYLRSASAIVGEGILASPATSPDSEVGTSFTVTAKVQNDNGQPLANRAVKFNIFAGPHAGTIATVMTNSLGQAQFTYTGSVPGVDEIKATFIDSQGNEKTSNTVVKRWIRTNRAPVPVCENVTRAVNDSCVAIVEPAQVGPSSYDPDNDPFSLALSPGGPFALGTTGVTLTATDVSNLSASCSATITAVDETLPTLSCPAPQRAECSANLSATVALGNASGADNCGPTTIDGPAGSASYPLGTTTVSFGAVDGSGNQASCTTTVTIEDTIAPELSCAASQVLECTGERSAIANIDAPVASDSCGGLVVSGESGARSFPVGDTTVGFSAFDSVGNANSCSTTVTVQDTTPPVIACAAPVTAECTASSSALVDVASPFAGDVCGGVNLQGPSGPSVYPLGSTALTFIATDEAGHNAQCSTAVTIVDTQAPAISCAAAIVAECTGNHRAEVDVPFALASDSCSAVSLTGPGGLGSYPTGSTALVFTAVDTSGNAQQCTTPVTVVDTTPPTIACPAPMFAECTGGAAVIDVVEPTATDSCGGVAIQGPVGLGSYPLGTTTLTFSALDDYGHQASCASTVIVSDTIAPVFDAASLAAQTVLGNCDGSPVSFALPIATDACELPTVTCTQVAGSSFGANTATCTATDPSGNTTTTTITVNVLAPLRVAFQSPLADDNIANDIATDADVANVFESKRTIPNKVKLYSCSGTDVTTSLAGSVTLRLSVTYRADGNPSAGTSIVPTYTGAGDAGGTFVLSDGHYQYNQKTDPGTYPTGSVNTSAYFNNIVAVSYNAHPSIVAGREDARLESK